jgi:O-antigen ligase
MSYAWDHTNMVGHGMMAMSEAFGEGIYPHESHLQAIFDLGILGAAAYLLITAIIPGALIVRRWLAGPISNLDAFLILWFLHVKINGELFHWTPYNWDIWASSILIYVLLARKTDFLNAASRHAVLPPEPALPD